jgi:hypothetical protein
MSGRAGYNAAPIVSKKANFCMFTKWRGVREWRSSPVILNLSTSCRPMKSTMLRLFLPLPKATHYQLHKWLCVLHSRCGIFEVTAFIIATSIIFLSRISVISHHPQMCYNLRVFQPNPPLVLYKTTCILYRDKFAKHWENVRFDITKHTYIRSWRVFEQLTLEEYVFLKFHTLYLFKFLCYPYTVQVRPWTDSETQSYEGQFKLCKLLGNLRDEFYYTNTSIPGLINLMSIKS